MLVTAVISMHNKAAIYTVKFTVQDTPRTMNGFHIVTIPASELTPHHEMTVHGDAALHCCSVAVRVRTTAEHTSSRDGQYAVFNALLGTFALD